MPKTCNQLTYKHTAPLLPPNIITICDCRDFLRHSSITRVAEVADVPRKIHIPPDLVVKSQAIDMAEIILSRIRRPNAVQTLCRNRISRFEQLSTSEAHWSTTKSDGMWNFRSSVEFIETYPVEMIW